VVTARPWRKHGNLIDLPSAVIAAGTAAGFQPLERCVALLAAVRDGHLVARPSFFQLQQVRNARARGIPMHLIAHEDVLIMIKEPETSHIPEAIAVASANATTRTASNDGPSHVATADAERRPSARRRP
jgi:hypothetical protein